MTEQPTVADIASALLQQPQPEPENESTGGTEETEALESQPVEEEESDELEDYEPDTEGDLEGDDESDDSEEPDRYTVKVDGEEVEVTLEEMAAGYQRDSDYRKKTMKVAEDRKAVEAKAADMDAKIAELDSFIKREEESIDWDALRRDDPALFLEKRESLDKAKEAQQKATEERQTQLQDQRQAMFKKEAAKLEEAMGPTWTNEQRNLDMKQSAEYLESIGITQEEMGQIADHRLWRVIFDAAKSHKLQETRTKVKKEVRKAPKSVKPGRKVPVAERKRKDATKRIQEATNRNQQYSALADLIKL